MLPSNSIRRSIVPLKISQIDSSGESGRCHQAGLTEMVGGVCSPGGGLRWPYARGIFSDSAEVAAEDSVDVRVVDYPGVTRLKGGVQVTELQKAKRRVKAIRAIRRSSELEGSRSTDATRADQVRYARGSITAAQLGDRVRRRYNVK
jgi:hypothetical protein